MSRPQEEEKEEEGTVGPNPCVLSGEASGHR